MDHYDLFWAIFFLPSWVLTWVSGRGSAFAIEMPALRQKAGSGQRIAYSPHKGSSARVRLRGSGRCDFLGTRHCTYPGAHTAGNMGVAYSTWPVRMLFGPGFPAAQPDEIAEYFPDDVQGRQNGRTQKNLHCVR